VVETRKTKLGDDHPDTLTSMDNLVLTYSKQDPKLINAKAKAYVYCRQRFSFAKYRANISKE
jgi:hypothetical protein